MAFSGGNDLPSAVLRFRFAGLQVYGFNQRCQISNLVSMPQQESSKILALRQKNLRIGTQTSKWNGGTH